MATTQEYIDSLKRDKQNIISDMNRLGMEMTDDSTFTDVANELSIYEPPVEDLEEVVAQQEQIINDLENAVANKSGKVFVVPDGMRFGKSYSLDISKLDFSNVTNFSHMFDSSTFTEIDISTLNIKSTTALESIFANCNQLISVNVSNLDMKNIKSCYAMFNTCTRLVNIDISNFNLENLTYNASMFSNCSKLSDESLKSILIAFKTATKLNSNSKNLKYIGLNSTQAAACAAFPEWQDLIELGWTTGL